MARLPSGKEILKLHVSSSQRKAGSASDWKFAVPGGQELLCEPGTRFSVADFTCHHAWYNITANNNRVFCRRKTSASMPLAYEDVSVSVTPGNYTSTTLINTVASLLSTGGRTLTGSFSHQTHTYSLTEVGGHGFLLFSDLMLRNHAFDGSIVESPASLNAILSTPDVDVTAANSFHVAWGSGLAVTLRLSALELRCPQLGGHCISCSGALDCIKRVPIITNFGEQLLDTSTINERDWLPCPPKIRVLDFRLCDEAGRVVETGGEVSFTLNFLDP